MEEAIPSGDLMNQVLLGLLTEQRLKGPFIVSALVGSARCSYRVFPEPCDISRVRQGTPGCHQASASPFPQTFGRNSSSLRFIV